MMKMVTSLPVSTLLLRSSFFLSFLVTVCASTTPLRLGCDPCINRAKYKIRAIYHGEQDDPFWEPIHKAAIQAGKDLGVDLDVKLYKTFDPTIMAQDITAHAIQAEQQQEQQQQLNVDALIVTIPDRNVLEAVRRAVKAGIPVFGINSGYQVMTSSNNKDDPIGLKAFVAQDEYLAGQTAAQEMLRYNISRALFVNHQVGNVGLENRRKGFEDTLATHAKRLTTTSTEEGHHRTPKIVDELVLDSVWTDAEIIAGLVESFKGCPYDVVQLGALQINEMEDLEAVLASCPDTKVGTFDVSKKVYRDIREGRLAFGISQQEYLQAVLPVHLAVTYLTTGKLPAPPLGDSNSGIYLSGPSLVTAGNVPHENLQNFAEHGFPVCHYDWNQLDGICFDRKKLRIGGVVHGLSTDSFWDAIFAGAAQAAKDMGNVELLMDRMDPPVDSDQQAITDHMANRIRSLCQQQQQQPDRVHGMFVSIPNGETKLLDAIRVCQRAHIPVVSINSGARYSRELKLMHHVGQIDYDAGKAAGRRMLEEGGISNAWCINYEPHNEGISQRCQGFAEALREIKNRTTVRYRGELNVPRDDIDIYVGAVEAAVGDDSGNWDGVGLLLAGQDGISPALKLLEKHPAIRMGSFGISNEIHKALDLGQLQFGIDEQPYLQGYMPIPLLTYFLQSHQQLQNEFIESGPSFVTRSPSLKQVLCEENHFQVCPTSSLEAEMWHEFLEDQQHQYQPSKQTQQQTPTTVNSSAQQSTYEEQEEQESTSDHRSKKSNVGAAIVAIVGIICFLAMVSCAATKSRCGRSQKDFDSSEKAGQGAELSEVEPTELEEGAFSFA